MGKFPAPTTEINRPDTRIIVGTHCRNERLKCTVKIAYTLVLPHWKAIENSMMVCFKTALG
uniref:Uncharacterized protein n=1 Tax=Anguilla anguilla TaxID=7936 RepID=A0A0E9XJM2_ANGAN